MSRSTSFSLLGVPVLLSLASALALVACAGSDVPVRGDEGVGANGGQTASNGGSANAGDAGSGGAGGSGTPAGGAGGASGAGGSGTGGSGDQQETGGTGGGSDCGGAALLVTHCGSSGCHGGSIGTFARDEASIGESIGQPSSINPGCGAIIDPDDATAGAIYDKINGAACGGSPMPLGPALTADDKACIESFLEGLTE